MAAHPFGPIETFLLRGYKKMGFDPSRVRPLFEAQRVKIFDINSPPDWLFQKIETSTYELERTAIVNNSENDLNQEVHDEKMDLLSRGLGYRITFTMPADREFQIHDQSTWPGVEFQLMDMFGDNIFRTVSIPQGHSFDTVHHLAPRLAQMNSKSSIEVEFTVEHIRVVVDKVHETLVPLYFPSGMSKIIEDRISNSAPVLQVSGRAPRDSENRNISTNRFELLREYLRNNHSDMSQTHKDKLKKTLLPMISFQYTNKAPVSKLKEDLENWFENKGGYPEYFDADFTSNTLMDCWRIGRSKEFKMTRWGYSSYLDEEFCTFEPKVYFTDRFIVVQVSTGVSASRISYCLKGLEHFPDQWLTFVLNYRGKELQVVAAQDMIAISDDSFRLRFSVWKLQSPTIEKKSIQPLLQTRLDSWRWFAGSHGIFLWKDETFFDVDRLVLLHFYSYSELERFHKEFPDEEFSPKNESLVGTVINLEDNKILKLPPGIKCQCIDPRVVQSQRSKLYFICEGIIMETHHIWIFTCLKDGTQILKKGEFSLPGQLWSHRDATWIEDSRGRMFGCVLNSPLSKEVKHDRIFVVVYHRGKFVPIGTRNKPTPGAFKACRHKDTEEYLVEVGKLSGKSSLLIKGKTYFDEHTSKYTAYRTLKLKH